jgi:hypothetical protein
MPVPDVTPTAPPPPPPPVSPAPIRDWSWLWKIVGPAMAVVAAIITLWGSVQQMKIEINNLREDIARNENNIKQINELESSVGDLKVSVAVNQSLLKQVLDELKDQ